VHYLYFAAVVHYTTLLVDYNGNVYCGDVERDGDHIIECDTDKNDYYCDGKKEEESNRDLRDHNDQKNFNCVTGQYSYGECSGDPDHCNEAHYAVFGCKDCSHNADGDCNCNDEYDECDFDNAIFYTHDAPRLEKTG